MRIGHWFIAHPTAIASAVSASAALLQMIWLVAHDNSAPISAGVITAWIAAIAALGIRQVVTPVVNPHDNAGNPLVPAIPPDTYKPGKGMIP